MRRTAFVAAAPVVAAIGASGSEAAVAGTGPQGSLDAVSLRGISGVEIRGWTADGTA